LGEFSGGGVGEVVLVERIHRFRVSDAEEMPGAVPTPDEAMVVDIPFFLFSDTGIIYFEESNNYLSAIDISHPEHENGDKKDTYFHFRSEHTFLSA
jgi:hypothetical protein